MIDQIDTALKLWVQTVLGNVDISLAPPDGARPGTGISLYLLELSNSPALGNGRIAPLQIMLRYLVTAWAAEPEAAHKLIGDLVFAAMQKNDFEVELQPVSVDFWRALNAVPRASFVLRVPLRRERPGERATLVTKPPVVRTSPIAVLEGMVLGPHDVPLMGAVVELTTLGLTTSTDSGGRFRFAGVPAEPAVQELKVRARGRSLSVLPETGGHQPLVIRFDGLEA